MNRFIIIFFSIIFLVLLFGCGGEGLDRGEELETKPVKEQKEKPKINLTPDYGVRGVFINTDFVKAEMEKPNCIILDARSTADYKKGHIPGAVNLGIVMENELPAWDILRDRTARFKKPDVAAEILGKAGINYDKTVIVYGKAGDYHACVTVQIMQYIGMANIYFLDGGYEAWIRESALNATKIELPVPLDFQVTDVREELYATTDMVYNWVTTNNPNIVLMDVRSDAEWEGIKIMSLRGGRIPGAVHKPVYDLFNGTEEGGDGKLISTEEWKQIYADIPKDKTIVIYCQRACRTTFPFFVLQSLGYKTMVYDESWRVWGSKLDLPVENEQWFFHKDVITCQQEIEKLQERVAALEASLESGVAAVAPPAKEESVSSGCE